MPQCRGIRGATTATENSSQAILAATRELLELLVASNDVRADDVTSVFFTLSDDLDAVYPALAAREMGWHDVALLCAREIPVPNSVERVVRILLHVNTELSQREIRHIYLREAVALRPTRAFQPTATGGDR